MIGQAALRGVIRATSPNAVWGQLRGHRGSGIDLGFVRVDDPDGILAPDAAHFSVLAVTRIIETAGDDGVTSAAHSRRARETTSDSTRTKAPLVGL